MLRQLTSPSNSSLPRCSTSSRCKPLLVSLDLHRSAALWSSLHACQSERCAGFLEVVEAPYLSTPHRPDAVPHPNVSLDLRFANVFICNYRNGSLYNKLSGVKEAAYLAAQLLICPN